MGKQLFDDEGDKIRIYSLASAKQIFDIDIPHLNWDLDGIIFHANTIELAQKELDERMQNHGIIYENRTIENIEKGFKCIAVLDEVNTGDNLYGLNIPEYHEWIFYKPKMFRFVKHENGKYEVNLSWGYSLF